MQTKDNGSPLSSDVGLAIVCGPFNQTFIHEAPSAMFGIDLHQHISVWVVASGSHHVMLRAIGVSEINPFVHVAGYD